MSDETTTDRLAKIEGQAEQPVQVREGRWKTRGGEIRNVTPTPDEHDLRDKFPWWDASFRNTWRDDGRYTHERLSMFDLVEYLRPIQPEPEQTITPDDVAAEALAGVFDQGKAEQEIAELQAQVKFLKNRELTLGTRLEDEKAVSTKRLEQVQELRSEVSHVQGLLGESQTRVVEQQNLIQELLITNEATEPQPVHLQAMIETQAETIARLHSEIHDLNLEIGGLQCKRTLDAELQTQLEAVKAELIQERLERNQWQNHAQRTETQLVEKVSECRNLRIELDALQQAPQAEPVAAVPTSTDDRFEQGWDAGTARAVETIAEWTEPFRQMIEKADNLVESDRASRLCAEIMQNLPHIMRTLTGLTDTED